MGDGAAKGLAFGDVERELGVTRKVLAAVPMERFDWKPHEKSMSLGSLAIHVADLPGWGSAALNDDFLDFKTAKHPPKSMANMEALLGHFDEKAEGLRAAIQRFDMGRWNGAWTMRNGEQVITTQSRPTVFRVWSMNHLINHRGQICVYLRLLNVAVPTVYFNTADDEAWVFG